MNEKFFALPKEKQHRILNAGYRVFAHNSYKKSPMSEIAAEAGISKSLLFHYFRDKKELYLYLWQRCGKETISALQKFGCYEQTDLFEMMRRGMRAKIAIMQQYPDISFFAVRAFYEKDEAVREDIQKSYRGMWAFKADAVLKNVDPDRFIPGLDLKRMYREMFLAAEGYLWECLQSGYMDVAQVEQDFTEMLSFWESIYLRKEGSYDRHSDQ